jgi:light-regulated signal transduction histidine kinase (bacteriophytochrome)
MVITIIVGLSIFFQIIAAISALALIRITGHLKAWIAIAMAILLMAVRRAISFAGMLTDGHAVVADYAAELVALATSILLVIGLAGIAPLFIAIRQSKEKLKESYVELEDKTKLLEETNNELESFAYTVSHDLGAPLNRLSGYLKLLREDHFASLNAQGREFVARLSDNTDRMRQLINDLLKFSRLTRSELHTVQVDLGPLAGKVFADLQQVDSDRRVELILGENLVAEADPAFMLIVLENLIGNAWKFTVKREHAVIELGRQRKDGKPVFFVRDNGVGFDMTQAVRLFTPFQRLHGEAEFAGTGIGLATVQRIIHRHGGIVWAEAQPDAGATFYFTLG